jgi:hypothetical protein
MNTKHVDVSLDKIRTIFEKASNRILALKVGEKITATGLAAELAEEVGMTGAQLYPTLKFLYDGLPPQFKVKKGAHGGIERLTPDPVEAPVVASALDIAEELVQKNDESSLDVADSSMNTADVSQGNATQMDA